MEQESYFPPPWNIYDHPEKTEGWIEFQKEWLKGNYNMNELGGVKYGTEPSILSPNWKVNIVNKD